MADNVVSNPGVGGATFATDEIGSVHYPKTKITWGPDETASDTTPSTPFPVDTYPGTVFSAVSASDVTDTTATQIGNLSGAGGSQRYKITAITVSNMHATVATRVDILSGSTVIWSGPAAAAGGGYVVNFPKPVIGGANEALKLQCGTTGATVRAAVAGYIGS